MTKTAAVYGDALYELAVSEGLEEELFRQSGEVADIFCQNPQYLSLLQNPSIPKEERLALLDAALRGGVHPYLLNFLKLLCERGKLRCYAGCAARLEERYLAAHNTLKAVAASAVPLGEVQQNTLRTRLEEITHKTVLLTCTVDPALIGGVRILLNGKVWDGTVQRRLKELGSLLRNTVL